MVSVKRMCQGVEGRALGVSRRACAFSSLSRVLRFSATAVLDGAFFSAFFTAFLAVFFGFGEASALGFRPTFFFPSAVFGPGFFGVVVLVVRRAGVRPVCALGRPTGRGEVEVA